MKNGKFHLLALSLGGLFFASNTFATNPIIMDQFTAAPTARVFEGKIYLYPSHAIPVPPGSGVLPSKNVTVPVRGVPPAAADVLPVAVSVTSWPEDNEPLDGFNTVVVAALATFKVNVAEAAAAWFASPG